MSRQTIQGARGVPIEVWTDTVDEKSRQQLLNTATLPCVFKHLAVMPDVHYGIGSTVGSVIATKQAVIPAAVGVDIGCGMMAARLPYVARQLPDNLFHLRSRIEALVPVGFSEHDRPLATGELWGGWTYWPYLHPDVQALMVKAHKQLGTLGGGNHFVEICLDTDENVWIMLHSGSRHIGNKLATAHIETAKGLFGESLKDLADPDLAYLSEGTLEFESYWRDLQWAQAYALMNRKLMMQQAFRAVSAALHDNPEAPIYPTFVVNCHHNYATREHHFGEDVIITRKGAVKAGKDDYGIIPGSMGARSFIVRGKGNPDAFCSCSHGAGRRMSRGEAKRAFTLEDVAQQTVGVECKKDASVLDEIPGAYKDIQTVMDHQKDLVDIVAELKQVLCVKG